MIYRFRLITDTVAENLEIRLNIFIEELFEKYVVADREIKMQYSCSSFGNGVMYTCLIGFELQTKVDGRHYDEQQTYRIKKDYDDAIEQSKKQ